MQEQTQLCRVCDIIIGHLFCFRDYLFKCIDCSVVVTTFLFEEHRIAVPLRNQVGQAIAVFDINLGNRQKLPTCEHRDLQKMLRTIQAAVCEILKEDSGEKDPFYVLGIVHLR